ncbi:MAG: nitrile hydratase [Vulcanimicrobiaceae bacterium]
MDEPAHDVGGRPENEPIPRGQHAFMPWEFRVDALMWILTDPTRPGGPRMTVDELRRGIESLPAAEYRSLGYYEKWLRSIVDIMLERGLVERDELKGRVAELEAAAVDAR